MSADPRVVDALDRLPGRKYVFTNGDVDYAGRVLAKLGLANAFDGVHDIHAMNYVPKPHPDAYRALCDLYAIDPARALFVEDMARNLEPAKALGMTTVWVDNGSEQAGRDANPAFIDYRITDVAIWLTQIVQEEDA
jgi:putative hydrolase of the HAD superfamily